MKSSNIKKSKKVVEQLDAVNTFVHKDLLLSALNDFSRKTSDVSNRNRIEYYNLLYRLRDNYITNGIYDIVVNDTFLDTGSDSVPYAQVTINNEDLSYLQDDILDMLENTDIFNILHSSLPNILHYGGLALRPVFGRRGGIIKLIDCYNNFEVLPIYGLDNTPLFYLVQKNIVSNTRDSYGLGISTISSNNFEFLPIDEILYFSVSADFEKIILQKNEVNYLKKQINSNFNHADIFTSGVKVKFPKSYMADCLDKLRETLLIDKLRVYKSIGNLLSPTVLGVPVPDSFDPAALVEVVQKMNNIVNSRNSLGTLDNPNITLQDITDVKIIPVAGDKSTPQVLDTGKDQRVIPTDDVTNSLIQLLNTKGISLDLFLGNMDTKYNIRRNARYSKSVKKMQKQLGRCIKFLILLHISSKYPDVDMSEADISIKFKNNNNADELENLEPQDLLLNGTNVMINTIKLLSEFQGSENCNFVIDSNKLFEKVKEQFDNIGSPLSEVIYKKDGGKNDTNISPYVPHVDNSNTTVNNGSGEN